MKKFKVMFQARETVWNGCYTIIEAQTKEEAYAKVKKSINEDNLVANFDSEWDGINTVTDEVIETTDYVIGDDYNCGIADVEEYKEDISCTLTLGAFDIARYGKNELYKMAEMKFKEIGVILDIEEMKMIPTAIIEERVSYDCVPIDYVKTWSNGDTSKHENGKMITPLFESLLVMNENIISSSCDYDRSTAIKLPSSFDIDNIDARMKELKTNVVNFRGINYIVGIYDDGYALWECTL